MNDETLTTETNYLFGRNWEDDLSEEELDEYISRAESLITKYGWPEVFNAWNDYLHTKCPTPESVVNFATLFWNYGGEERPIPEPHKFLGYMLFRIDCDILAYDNGDIIEAIATEILPKAGFTEADLFLHPYYAVDKDPNILAEVEYWKRHNS